MNALLNLLNDQPLLKDAVVLAGILLGTFLLSRIIPALERFLSRQITGRTETELDDRILELVAGSSRRIVWLIGIYVAVRRVGTLLSERVYPWLNGFFYVLIVLFIANMVCHLFQLLLEWYAERWNRRVKGRSGEEFLPLLRKLIYIVVYTIAAITVLHHFDQSVSSIIVSLGVGSLAVALAAKDTLANMIAGFMIMTDRPFRINDRIMLESGEKGDVYDIGLRTTKILTFDNTLIVVPNHKIINEKVTNLSYPNAQIRVKIEVGVAYGTDLEKAKRLLEVVCSAHEKVVEDPPPKAYFTNFGDSSLDLMVVCRVPEWKDQWEVGEALRMEINRVFVREGIEIPFPQRDVNLKKE